MDDVAQTLASDWKYVSEGGATIVFSYVGSPNPSYDGMVLRLRKAVNLGRPVDGMVNEDEPDDPIIEYQKRCMERLLSRENLPLLRSVRLERTWLEQLAEKHDKERPEARSRKDQIDFTRQKGVLATDLVGGDWIAVEVKPKWAFLPSHSHLSEETKAKKVQTCRFCMHSFMRNKKNPEYVNHYCPLDLFSGEADRVRKAIDALWDAWEHSNGGVNNLKLFAHGKVVLPGQIERLVDEKTDKEAVHPEQIKQMFKQALFNTLMKTSVLKAISRLQRTLDPLDIEGLSKLWRETELQSPLYKSEHASYSEQPVSNERIPTTPLGASSIYLPASEPSISDWVEFITNYQSNAAKEMDHSQPKADHLRYYLLAYLLSATFKDCSIIVKLDFLRPGRQSTPTVYPVSVIDLDPKSLDRLQKWEQLDREIGLSKLEQQSRTRKTVLEKKLSRNEKISDADAVWLDHDANLIDGVAIIAFFKENTEELLHTFNRQLRLEEVARLKDTRIDEYFTRK
ncbi:hypothetical protein NP233_g6638 [Leucocoprinus birnbaumii]|uniref:Inositol-pentakisphosphate 2-kinase n=1 Tax=Leucocoprinus birnbaumii TaxID=56174 RepID=A0AAD5VU81_9AGAR|nr:hypothetical protein NP233_g6638 [Leucocoprinus birnbaumii]